MADAEASAPAKKSDLGVRTLSAVVMLAIAIGAVWLGGVWLDGFIAVIALIALGEFVVIVSKAGFSPIMRTLAILLGAAYIMLAAVMLIEMEVPFLIFTVVLVIGIDVGAYLVGRKFGRHKIAPAISPGKSWEGLFGAMAVSGLLGFLAIFWVVSMAAAFSNSQGGPDWMTVIIGTIICALLAVVAQAGDFLESWLKRRAGLKDSSKLIPGHGGVFDRIDGLIPVAIVAGFAEHWL